MYLHLCNKYDHTLPDPIVKEILQIGKARTLRALLFYFEKFLAQSDKVLCIANWTLLQRFWEAQGWWGWTRAINMLPPKFLPTLIGDLAKPMKNDWDEKYRTEALEALHQRISMATN